MLDFAVELHREFAEGEGGSIGSTTNEEDPLFFLGLQTELVRAGAMRNNGAEGGRKEDSERAREGIGDPFDRHSRIWLQL